MNKSSLIDVVEIPAHVLDYVLTGNADELNQEEQSQVDEWLTELKDNNEVEFDVYFESLGFSTSPAFGLPCETYNAKLFVK